jgi:hypothetical protein
MVSALETVVDAGVDGATWSLSPKQLAELLPRLDHQLRRLEAAQLAMLGEADRHQVGDPLGFANTVGWWSQVTRATKPQARRQLKLAEQLDLDEHKSVRVAALQGAVSVEQASVIIKAVEELPRDLTDPGLRAKAQNHLIGLADELDPKELRIAGRKILEVEAPEIAEQALDRVLQAEEQHAAQTASFTMRPDGHGSMLGRFKVPLLAGRMLEKHLGAIAAPKHQNALAAANGTTPRPWSWGTAFAEYIETRPTKGIPKAGGIAATVVVTMSLETLMGGLKAASLLETGEAISASQARRLACEAAIIPAVLGARSEVLDLGRRRRLHNPAQRIAIALREKTCIVEGCDRGPGDCHFHHLRPWSEGGGTSVKDGAMICATHHTQIHDPRYGHDPRPHAKIRFYRRT